MAGHSKPDPVPANLRPFTEVLGEELAVSFFLKFGGAPLYLSENPTADGQLATVVGPDNVRALTERLGAGQLPRVPINRRWLARRMHGAGWSVLAIAREMHVTDVTVRGWLSNDPRPRRLPGGRRRKVS